MRINCEQPTVFPLFTFLIRSPQSAIPLPYLAPDPLPPYHRRVNDMFEGLRIALADQYDIDKEIGRGGMATVFLARDLKHQRQVALKVLRPDLATSLGSERFLREVQIAAALMHPHILPVHDSGEANGLLYYVMPFVAGESLRGRLDREKQLPIDEAIEITREVADALAYAHAQGVVHRDIKPENILLPGGRHASVADFGIATAVAYAAGDQQLTERGLAVGTPAYMSPEQAGGETGVDGRSDIYSLGCVLFEMLAGSPPFRGPTALSVIAQHISEHVPDLHALRETIPVSVETVVKRALAKTPADRYQSAAKLAAALASIPTRWSSGFRRIVTHDGEDQAGESIAVLPFVNMSSDEENEYFSDGMTEELIHALTKVDGLRVASRTSAFAFKGKDADAREIGRKLNVTTLLEGSVRKAGNKLRVAAQLIKVADGYHIWSETFERDLKDVFAVQDDIANRIVETLKLTLLGERKSLVVPPTVNVEAYNDYLRGRFHWNKRSEEALQRGIGCFGDAVRVDPHFALAYVGLADSYIVLGGYGYLPTRDAYTRAKAEAIKALEIDEDLAEAHTSLAYVRTFYDWDWAAADRAFRRAIELNPHYPTARQWYGQYLASLGRFDEAVATLRRALQLDPLSLPICASMGRALYYARRFDEAISQCRSALEMEPTFALAHAWLGMAYLAKRETPQAMAELEKAVELTHGNPVLLAGLGAAYAAAGERTKALKILAALKEEAKRRRVLPVFVAVVHGELGEADEAFRWLDVAYEERSDWLVSLKVSPWFDSLRHDARFDQLLRKMQLE